MAYVLILSDRLGEKSVIIKLSQINGNQDVGKRNKQRREKRKKTEVMSVFVYRCFNRLRMKIVMHRVKARKINRKTWTLEGWPKKERAKETRQTKKIKDRKGWFILRDKLWTLHGILGKLSLQFLHHGTLFVLCCATKEKTGFDGRITGCQTQAKACGYYKSLTICHV